MMCGGSGRRRIFVPCACVWKFLEAIPRAIFICTGHDREHRARARATASSTTTHHPLGRTHLVLLGMLHISRRGFGCVVGHIERAVGIPKKPAVGIPAAVLRPTGHGHAYGGVHVPSPLQYVYVAPAFQGWPHVLMARKCTPGDPALMSHQWLDGARACRSTGHIPNISWPNVLSLTLNVPCRAGNAHRH